MQESEPVPQTDEEWEAALASLNDDELVAYLLRVHQTISQNPDAYPSITLKHLEDLYCKAETFRMHVQAAKIADQNAAIAKAKMERSADEMLKDIDNTGRKAIYLPPKDILGKKGN